MQDPVCTDAVTTAGRNGAEPPFMPETVRL